MLENIEIILSVFLLFYLFIVLYDFITLYFKNNEIIYNDKKQNILVSLIIEHESTDSNDKINEINKKLVRKLKKLSYLFNFGILLERNVKIKALDNKQINSILSDSSYDSVFIRLATIYEKKESLDKSYYAYILKYIHPDRDEIYQFLYNCVLSTAIYCIENALFAFYYIGDCKRVCEVYKMMSRENIYYNHRLISDGMMNFTGSKMELCSDLYQSFDYFNDETKIGILTFFRDCKYNIKDEILIRLQNSSNEKEVEIAMIRYFFKVYSSEANELFIDRIEKNYYHDFDYDIVMIQVLGQMEKLSKKAVNVLEKCLSNSNYYIRYNAAKVLHNKNELRTIKNVDDPFMKDMIEYFISQEV